MKINFNRESAESILSGKRKLMGRGLSFAEISEVVGAKEGTVKSRMRYALTSLRSALAEYADYARTLP